MSRNNSLKKQQRQARKVEERLKRELEAREVKGAARKSIEAQTKSNGRLGN